MRKMRAAARNQGSVPNHSPMEEAHMILKVAGITVEEIAGQSRIRFRYSRDRKSETNYDNNQSE